MKNQKKMFYCMLSAAVFFVPMVVRSQVFNPIDWSSSPLSSRITEDFFALSNCLHKAIDVAEKEMRGEIEASEKSFPRDTLQHVSWLFNVMSIISTSKVEVICFCSSGFNARSEILLFWLTRDSVYRTTLSVRPSFSRPNNPLLSVSQTWRTKTFDATLDAFEDIPFRQDPLFSLFISDAPHGFYVRRTPNGVFDGLYFSMVTFEDTGNPKVPSFARLLKIFDQLMEKNITWKDGIPETIGIEHLGSWGP